MRSSIWYISNKKLNVIEIFYKKQIMNLFLCKLRYYKIVDTGALKEVTEQFAVEALSFTEAEARIIEEMTPFISGDFMVKDISRMNIAEAFDKEDGDRYYKVKVNFLTTDERTGAEKKTPHYMLVRASDMETAKEYFIDGMRGTMLDFEVEQYVETKIMDLFRYVPAEELPEGSE